MLCSYELLVEEHVASHIAPNYDPHFDTQLKKKKESVYSSMLPCSVSRIKP